MTGVPATIRMYQPTPDFDDEDINLGDLLGVLIENRWLIIAVTLVALLIGGYKSFTAVSDLPSRRATAGRGEQLEPVG